MDIGKGFSEVMVLASGIVGLAVIAVLVSRQAQTSQVINAAGGAFSQSLGAALSPVTGNLVGLNAGGGWTG